VPDRTVSIGTMIRQLAGMADTKDLSDWESRFLKNIVARSNDGTRTSSLSDDQVEKIDEIWRKHFG
jgi:hypothetical protein